MDPSVYLETSVISYLTTRPSRDLIVAARQQITQEWWQSSRHHYHCIASDLVVEEAEADDPHFAALRLAALADVELVATSEEARLLTRRLLEEHAFPPAAANDAAHVALATAAGAHYLLT